MISSSIFSKLSKEFNPQLLEVLNESHKHALQGKETHFKITLVSQAFTNISRLNRHRLINDLLKEEIPLVHSLSYHLFTEEEWKGCCRNSPKCHSFKEF